MDAAGGRCVVGSSLRFGRYLIVRISRSACTPHPSAAVVPRVAMRPLSGAAMSSASSRSLSVGRSAPAGRHPTERSLRIPRHTARSTPAASAGPLESCGGTGAYPRHESTKARRHSHGVRGQSDVDVLVVDLDLKKTTLRVARLK